MNPLFSRSWRVLGSVALVTALVATSAVPAHASVSNVPPLAVSADQLSVAASPYTLELSGVPVVGQQLHVETDAPVGTEITWLRNGSPVPGATRTSPYRLSLDDACALMSVRINPPASTGAQVQESAQHGPIEFPVSAVTAPGIVGAAVVGKTLSARTGAWPSGTRLSYRWLRNGKSIAGATGAQYLLGAADRGQAITVNVTGSIGGCFSYPSLSTAAGSGTIAAAVLSAATPKTTGSAKVGATLTAKPGAWTPGTEFSYQWLRNGKAIPKATKSTYVQVSGDLATRLAVKVTGSKAGYATASKTSGQTGKVVAGALKAAAPKITGSAKVGASLTAKPGSWTSGTAFSYQWLRNGKAISRATKSTYSPVAADRGTRISVKVMGKKSGYTTVSKASAQTGKVAAGTLSGTTPKISGTAKVGNTLKVTKGNWSSGTKISYQWLRGGKAISKATGTSYKPTAADAGQKISARVTASRSGYSTLAKTSAQVGPVKAAAKPKPPSNRANPVGKNCPASHPIKGNANSGIYHVPSGAYYSRTVPEDCFKTEAAAKAAGYRKSKR